MVLKKYYFRVSLANQHISTRALAWLVGTSADRQYSQARTASWRPTNPIRNPRGSSTSTHTASYRVLSVRTKNDVAIQLPASVPSGSVTMCVPNVFHYYLEEYVLVQPVLENFNIIFEWFFLSQWCVFVVIWTVFRMERCCCSALMCSYRLMTGLCGDY